MTRLLGVFAKHWTPGQVKTRLAGTVGHDAAARLSAAFLRTTLLRFQHSGDRRALVFSPRDRPAEFEPLCSGKWELVPQTDGDLGCRMRHFVAVALEQGVQRVVLIGADSPTLPGEHVQRAFDLLADHPVVLGPTPDGGYYLLGISRQVPPIFEGISWSTPQVWQQTTARLAAAQVAYEVLPEWYDVDEPADLDRLRCDVQQLVVGDPDFHELYDELQRQRGNTV